MPLTADQQAAIKAALQEHLNGCPICHTNRWQLQADIVFLPIIEGTGVNLGKGQPCAAAICGTCSSVQLFNVFFLGIADKLGFKGEADGDS